MDLVQSSTPASSNNTEQFFTEHENIAFSSLCRKHGLVAWQQVLYGTTKLVMEGIKAALHTQ